MANMIELSGPTPTQQIISHFLDQFNQNRQARAQQESDQQRLDVGQQQANTMQDQFKLAQQKYSDEGKRAEAAQWAPQFQSYYRAIQSTTDQNQQAALEAQLKSFTDDFQQKHPDLVPYVATAMLAPIMADPARQTELNAGKYAATQTGIAAGGGTDPTAVNLTTKIGPAQAFMPPEGFKQQQAADLAARAAAAAQTSGSQPQTTPSAGAVPNLKQPIPAPSGNAVPDYEARQVGAMTTGAENLTAQTGITEAAMRERGAMERQKQEQASNATTGAATLSADVQELVDNPDVWQQWDATKKKAYLQAGGRVPNRVDANERRRETQSRLGIQILDDVSGVLDKWNQRGIKISGPLLGRYNEASRTWGAAPIPSGLPPNLIPEYEGDISKIQEWLGANKVGEVTAIVGGRANYQYLKELAPPVISQNTNFLRGSIDGMKQRFQETLDVMDKARWGKAGPPKGYTPSGAPSQSTSGIFDYVPGQGLVPH